MSSKDTGIYGYILVPSRRTALSLSGAFFKSWFNEYKGRTVQVPTMSSLHSTIVTLRRWINPWPAGDAGEYYHEMLRALMKQYMFRLIFKDKHIIVLKQQEKLPIDFSSYRFFDITDNELNMNWNHEMGHYIGGYGKFEHLTA